MLLRTCILPFCLGYAQSTVNDEKVNIDGLDNDDHPPHDLNLPDVHAHSSSHLCGVSGVGAHSDIDVEIIEHDCMTQTIATQHGPPELEQDPFRLCCEG